MVVWFSKEMTCPMCRTRLCGREVGGGFVIGQDSDLLIRMKGKHVIQAEIHTCLNCRYSGYVRDFQINTLPDVADRFCNEVTPQLTGGPKNSITSTPLSDIQYFWSYESARFLARPSLALGNLLLRAYWCLRMPPSSHLSAVQIEQRRRRYLEGSVSHFRQSLRGNRNPHLYYVLGELNRRVGDFELADKYFAKFLTKRNTAKYLREAAIKLILMARDGDSREMTMEQVLYDQKTESS